MSYFSYLCAVGIWGEHSFYPFQGSFAATGVWLGLHCEQEWKSVGQKLDSLQCSCPVFWGDTFKYQGSGTYQLFLCAYLQHGGIFSQAEIFTALPVFALFIELVTFVLMPPPFIWARAASVSLEENKQTLVNYLLPRSAIFPLLEINSVWYSKNQFISLRHLSEHLCYPPTPP